MSWAIETRYVGPTSTRGGRIAAALANRRIFIPYPPELLEREAHRKAAVELCKRFSFGNCDRLIQAESKAGYVFVPLPTSCNCPETMFQGLRRKRLVRG